LTSDASVAQLWPCSQAQHGYCIGGLRNVLLQMYIRTVCHSVEKLQVDNSMVVQMQYKPHLIKWRYTDFAAVIIRKRHQLPLVLPADVAKKIEHKQPLPNSIHLAQEMMGR